MAVPRPPIYVPLRRFDPWLRNIMSWVSYICDGGTTLPPPSIFRKWSRLSPSTWKPCITWGLMYSWGALPRRPNTRGADPAACAPSPSRSAASSTPRRPDTVRPERAPGRGTGAVSHAHSAGRRAPGGERPVQPSGAEGIVHPLGHRDIHHAPIIAHPAR
jgi:hypothetical protein